MKDPLLLPVAIITAAFCLDKMQMPRHTEAGFKTFILNLLLYDNILIKLVKSSLRRLGRMGRGVSKI